MSLYLITKSKAASLSCMQCKWYLSSACAVSSTLAARAFAFMDCSVPSWAAICHFCSLRKEGGNHVSRKALLPPVSCLPWAAWWLSWWCTVPGLSSLMQHRLTWSGNQNAWLQLCLVCSVLTIVATAYHIVRSQWQPSQQIAASPVPNLYYFAILWA